MPRTPPSQLLPSDPRPDLQILADRRVRTGEFILRHTHHSTFEPPPGTPSEIDDILSDLDR